MQWEFIVALAVAIPVILFPAAFIWYLNVGGVFAAIREALKRRDALRAKPEALAGAETKTEGR